MIARSAACVLLAAALQPLPVPGGEAPADTRPVATDSAPATPPRIRTFQKGIRIDWTRRQVEVDGAVSLREGAIELFACSPNTREYESIVRLDVRPLHVFQALGLIGLAPGHPIRLNPETQQVEPAVGDGIEIFVRFTRDGRSQEVAIEQWLQRANSKEPVEALPWVFAGSVRNDDGTFAADGEGTIVALVDFATAIVALPERHSDRNEELWLEPATSQIPPEKTPCTVIFRQAPLRLGLDPAGRVLLDHRPVTIAQLRERIAAARRESPGRRVRLRIHPRCPAQDERDLKTLLESLGIPASEIYMYRPPLSAAPQNDPRAMTAWLRKSVVGSRPAETAGQLTADSAQRLADDLRERSVDFRNRTEQVVDYATHLSGDLQRLVSPDTAPASMPSEP